MTAQPRSLAKERRSKALVVVTVPVAEAGTLIVKFVLGVIAVMVTGYVTVPEPSVVNALAEPPTVLLTWKVFAVALTT